MFIRLAAGWNMAQRHPWMISMLFIYKLVWGLVIYRIVQAVVLPLLYRFPSEHSDLAVHVFMAEAQFQLLKTNVAHLPLVLIAIIVLARMVMTPLLNAGIYYSIIRDEDKQIRPFIKGVKTLGARFIIIYSCQLLSALLPLFWMLPYVQHKLAMQSLEAMLVSLLLPIAVYWVYLHIIRLLFMYVQFSQASGMRLTRSFAIFFSNFGSIIVLSCALLLITAVLAMLNMSLTLVWVSLLSIMLYQLYYLTKAFMSIWEICAQYDIWRERTQKLGNSPLSAESQAAIST